MISAIARFLFWVHVVLWLPLMLGAIMALAERDVSFLVDLLRKAILIANIFFIFSLSARLAVARLGSVKSVRIVDIIVIINSVLTFILIVLLLSV